MKTFLVTGVKSGLGKYFYENLPNSYGLDRNNFDSIKDKNFDAIIHCAFNKETSITDYKKYLDDNIFLVQRLKQLNHSKFIYISSIDVYQKNPNIYSHFKKLAETLVDNTDLVLRCSMLVGPTMKLNHLSKIKDNTPNLSLSPNSEFNYILMSDVLEFFSSGDYIHYEGILDFVSNNNMKLEEVKEFFNSSTELGDSTYESTLDFCNPIFNLNQKYNKSSLENLNQYYGK